MRILVADHDEQALRALQIRFDEAPGIEHVAVASEAESLVRLAEEIHADLVLVDGELPGKPIDLLIADLHALEPRPKVIVMGNDLEAVRKYLKYGTDAYVSKGERPEWLFETVCRYWKKHNQPIKQAEK